MKTNYQKKILRKAAMLLFAVVLMLNTNFVMAQQQGVKSNFDCLIGYYGSEAEPINYGQTFCAGTILNFSTCSYIGAFENYDLPGDMTCDEGKLATYTIKATNTTTGLVVYAHTSFSLPIVPNVTPFPVVQLILTAPGCYIIEPYWSYVSECSPEIQVITFTQGLYNDNRPTNICITNQPVNATNPKLVQETPNPICVGSEVCFKTDFSENNTMIFQSGAAYTFKSYVNSFGVIVRQLVSNNPNNPILPLQLVSYTNTGTPIVRVCYTYPTAATYQVLRTNGGTCGGANQIRFVLVNVLDNKTSFTAVPDCNGNVTFTPTVKCANPAPATYYWTFGDGTTATSTGVITHQYTSSNTFNVTVNANGGALATQNVNVVTAPNVDLQATFSTPTKACSPQETYSLTGVPAGFTINWSITGGNLTTPNNQATVGVNWIATETDPVAGPYIEGGSLSVTITNGSCVYTKTFEVGTCCASRTATQNISSPKGEIGINDVFPTVSQLTGGTYYIDGRLIIDKDFALIGTHFKMGPYAEIYVIAPYTFALDNAKITAGCDIMWQQILVENKASFVAKNNSRIEDGITAVYGDNGGAINIKDSYLNKNYIAVTAVNYNNGTYPLEITNTKISCSYALPYAVVGVTYPNIGLRPPYLTERGLRGIELDMVENAKIGDPTNSANKNEFYQLDYGIYARRSSVEVYNNHFKEIYDPNKINSKEYAIYANNLNKPLIKTNSTLKVGDPVNPIAKNKFEVCEVGIETNNNVNSYIYNNTFDDMFWAVRINFNNNNNTVKINQNNITDMMRGVECNLNTWCNTDISLNSFNYNQTPISMPANAFGEYGILINEENKPAGGIYTIKSNTVRNVVFGVEVKGTDKTTIENNKIRIEPLFVTSTTLGYEAAIRILNTSGTSAKCNDIATTASAANIRSAANFQKYNGVFTSQAIGASIIDNKIENIGAGTNFGGTCTGCSVFKNDFKKLATGVFLSHGVQLGTQGSIVLGPVCKNITSDNTWATPLTQNTTVDALTMNPTNIANTKFVIRTTNNGSPYAAQSNGSFANYNFQPTGGITNISAQGCYLDQNCHTKKTPRELVLREKLAKSQISFAQNDAVTKYINKALIYSEILADDSLAILSPVLTAFRDSATSANLGALQSIKAILTDTLLQTNVVLVNALAQNNSLIVNELPEATRQQVNNIVLQAAIVDTLFTTTQVDSLRNIAMLCPYIYGPAVFSARALVNYYDPINTHYFNDCEKITVQQHQNRGAYIEDTYSNNIEQIGLFTVSPNPSSGNLQVEFIAYDENEQQNLKQLTITDVLGRIVRTYSGNDSNSILIEKTGLTKGIYIIQIQLENGTIQSSKWLIQED